MYHAAALNSRALLPGALLPYYLYQYPLAALAVELAVEDLFPGTKVKPAAGNGCNHFTAHDLPFQVGIGINLAGVVAVT